MRIARPHRRAPVGAYDVFGLSAIRRAGRRFRAVKANALVRAGLCRIKRFRFKTTVDFIEDFPRQIANATEPEILLYIRLHHTSKRQDIAPSCRYMATSP